MKNNKGFFRNKFKKIKENKLYFCISIILILVIVFFSLFWVTYSFIFISSPIGIIEPRYNSDWLQWMSGIIGGIIGGVTTFIGIKMTISNERELIEFENKKKALPMIELSEGENSYTNKYIQVDFCFTNESNERERKNIVDTENITIRFRNVGLRELYDFHICDIESEYYKSEYVSHQINPILYQDGFIDISFNIYEKGIYDSDETMTDETLISPISFKCYYLDCYDNWYFQKFSVSVLHKLEKGIPVDKKALTVNIERFEIMSKPTEVNESKLPFRDGNSLIIC